ncbi:MAG: hypothetical protein QM500_12420 [Methylococcales bacterium]
MSIQKEVIVRYKADGHVRFALPEQLCNEATAEQIVSKIKMIDGVYRVNLFKKQKKLSIRYQDVVCDFNQLSLQFFQLLSELDESGLLDVSVVTEVRVEKQSKWNVKDKVKNWKASRWVAEKYGDAKETAQAAKVIAKIGLKKPKSFVKDPEKAVIDFLNDILVLYLIRLHWTRITQEWLLKPWAFKSQWVAVFYLFYLLVRSRRPAK